MRAEHIATAGDSAGGNLSTGVVLKLWEEGVPLPAAIVAFSRWYDMENTGANMDTNAATDVLVQRPGLEEMVEMFLGEHGSPSDPLANPLHADLAGQETLLDDAVRLAKKATAAGVDVTLTVTPEMQHLYQLMAGHAPEATEAIADVAAWMRPKLGLGRRRQWPTASSVGDRSSAAR